MFTSFWMCVAMFIFSWGYKIGGYGMSSGIRRGYWGLSLRLGKGRGWILV